LSRFLALDGDTNLIQVLSATVKGDSVRLEKSLAWEEEQPVNSTNAAAIGGRLREQLKSAGIAPAPLLVSIGRDRVVLKEIRIPSVAEHEEPALVRFQAMKEFTDGGDEVVLDYTPLGPAGPEGRRVQVMSVRKEVLKAFRALAEAAGLKVAAMTPRPFALLSGLKQAIRTSLVPAPEPADAPIGLLVRGPKWGEFAIVRGGVLALTRSVAGPALSSDTALLGEIRRNIALYANQNSDNPVRALYLAEPDTPGGLRDRLQDSLAIAVHAYEPLVGIAAPDGPPGTLAGLAGLFAQQASRDATINFANPREPKPPRDPNKRLLGICAAAVAVVFVVLGTGAYLQVSSKRAEVDGLQKDLADSKAQLLDLHPEEERIKALDSWTATNINWLDELYDMTSRLPDTRNIRMISIAMNSRDDHGASLTAPAPGQGSASKKEFGGSILLRGLYSSDGMARQNFDLSLIDDPEYFVPNSTSIKPNTILDQLHFSSEFQVKIDINRRPPDKYTRSFTAKPIDRQTLESGNDPLAEDGGELKPGAQLNMQEGGRR
jgi:Tfp pilus assembly PilM family ATPase